LICSISLSTGWLIFWRKISFSFANSAVRFFNFAPTPPPVRSTSADHPAAPDTAPLPFYFLPLPSPEETNQILFALVVVLLVVRVDNPTPIILDLGKAITLGILRTREPWPSTKLSPGMGELCADAASMRTQEFGS
jgi:hypothetical protein